MINLREAFKLTEIRNNEVVYLLPIGASRWDSISVTGRQVRERYDMRRVKVYYIKPRFSSFGEFCGMQFVVSGLTQKGGEVK